MVVLRGYAHIVEFFAGFEWWKTEPGDGLVSDGGYCLAEPGKLYAIYLPRGSKTTIKLEPGRYRVSWFNPRTSETKVLPAVEGPKSTSPDTPDNGDWAMLLKRGRGKFVRLARRRMRSGMVW